MILDSYPPQFMIDKPDKLLNVDKNYKTVKGQRRGYLTGILYLHPHISFGFNLCPMAEAAGCHEICLHHAGRGQMVSVQAGRLRKTWLFHNERDWFMRQLYLDIEALVRKAEREGLTPCVRLNGTSDLDWEKLLYRGKPLMAWFPLVQFYDYTKIPRLPKHTNYHLTFSYSPTPAFAKTVRKAERLRMNMAVVFQKRVPIIWNNKDVIDGDDTDLRFLDPPGAIIGLKAKGYKAKQEGWDFIVRVAA